MLFEDGKISFRHFSQCFSVLCTEKYGYARLLEAQHSEGIATKRNCVIRLQHLWSPSVVSLFLCPNIWWRSQPRKCRGSFRWDQSTLRWWSPYCSSKSGNGAERGTSKDRFSKVSHPHSAQEPSITHIYYTVLRMKCLNSSFLFFYSGLFLRNTNYFMQGWIWGPNIWGRKFL